MGMATRIYGIIVEYGLEERPRQSEIYKHNTNIIDSLPLTDTWPPLSKNMFGITQNVEAEPSPNYEYSGRIIHFGGNFKSIELDWILWKKKFEELLTLLFWLEAEVNLETEYSPRQTFIWSVDLSKWSLTTESNGLLNPIKEGLWYFEGDDSHLLKE